jgi:lipid-A-disaccharide synthase
MNSILIVAGENSGERYGADVVREFKKRQPGFSFFGVGGKKMRQEGVDLVFTVDELSAIGIFEVVAKIPRIMNLASRLEDEIGRRKPLGAVLIDSPDFNLHLARKLKKKGTPVLYYISPTVWAWRSGRLKTIKRVVTRMCLIFPFERELYEKHGISAAFIGHPLKEKVRTQLSREEFFRKYSLPYGAKIIALLPGSRRTELKNHLPVLRQAVRRMKTAFPVHFLLLLAESLARSDLDRFIGPGDGNIQVIDSDAYDAIAYSDVALSACGTANLEAALLGTPFVAFYRVSPLTYYPFRRFLKIRDYSIVNILAGKRVVPELIQRRFSAKRLAEEAERLLFSEETKAQMRAEFRRIASSLGRERASENVARELERVILPGTPREPEAPGEPARLPLSRA